MIELYPEQLNAVKKMKNGCILCGGTGSGKTITSLAYYFTSYGGKLKPFRPMITPPDLYIITSPKKRDSGDWEDEMNYFHLGVVDNYYKNKVVVDSWNNIKKYSTVTNAFFIFDEQRVIGKGVWVKAFLTIAKHNKWILLSATPGDTWMDYVPVFIANGFFKNRTEFEAKHCIFKYIPGAAYRKVDRYCGVHALLKLRDSILIDIPIQRSTVQHHIDVMHNYDQARYKDLVKLRWNSDKDRPIENAAELCFELRKLVNSDVSRVSSLIDILAAKKKVIVFYNYDYELNILLNIDWPKNVEVAQWNGHKHQEVPDSDKWIYLVQYAAGNEAWNCIKTNTIVFYSQHYSYKVMKQASGRIDRLNTKFIDLYYYHFKSRAPIDIGIERAIKNKKRFNEEKFVKW
ncbi:MAG: DEAD/DEAH box helicase family protein [Pseudobutyrivibrio sp.]|nr:DEAD/DEAH box helicase family protein [Pseudobutyrivibrio sp.]